MNQITQNQSRSPIFQQLRIVSNLLDESYKIDAFMEKEDSNSKELTIKTDTYSKLDSLNSEDAIKNFETFDSGSGQKDVEKELDNEIIENSAASLNGYSKIQELKLVKIGLASSERIVEWAEKVLPNGKIFGEVLNANTLHYKTFKPHKGGLFCERIFGPLKDFECACGVKQKPSDFSSQREGNSSTMEGQSSGYVQSLLETKKSKRIFCPECDVEYTWSVIRRYQLGYIQLISPVSHLWYLQANPSYLSLLLDIRKKDLESIIYCMQITTLEYYWKPLQSLQMNLNASNLFESYKKFVLMTSSGQNGSSENFLELKKLEEIKKRKNMKISRQAIYLTSNVTLDSKRRFEKPLQRQIEDLEKSFQLSSADVYPNTLSKVSKVTSFLKQKISKKLKKQSFLTIYKKVLEEFYQESYIKLSKTHAQSRLTALNDKSSSELLLIKKYLDAKSKTHSVEFSEKKLRSVSNELNLLRKSVGPHSWKSVYKNDKAVLSFFSTFNLNYPQNLTKLNFDYVAFSQILQQCVFLYFLFTIQENSDSFLKNPPSTFKIKEILNKLIFGNSEKLNLDLFNSKDSNYDFLSKFLQTNFLANTNQKNLKFFEIEKAFKTPKTIFVKWLNTVIERVVFFGFKSDNFEKNSLKDILITSSQQELNVRSFLLNFEKSNSETQKLPQRQENLIEQLIVENKLAQFFKNQSSYPQTARLYVKNSAILFKNLIVRKNKPIFPLFNNIYTVAYSKGWETEKDWKYFLYYNTAPTEITDDPISVYKYRFSENAFFNPLTPPPLPILGGHFLQKILMQYEDFELQKMAKQHQNLLPKLNRYIRLRKQTAKKKSDFSQIQKLLQKRDLIIRQLKLLRKLFKRNSKPSSMILKTLPVLPPDLRPILKMQNQIAASDLNRFYQRIIYRNDRLKKFLKTQASLMNYEPGFEIKYAQRLLQEAVDNLIQNGKGSVKPETNSRGQPLKSLSEILKGKQGRFRQYLLGKRVDYSGRSVIVVGPSLKISQCGLPFEMAMELFLPFLIKRIFQYQLARTVIGAKTILKTQKKLTWELLEEVMQNHPILLNRAPTLHRLGIQAFQPKLVEGRAILLHPLVCPAFNADFDGDQMAVHVPITVEARTEAWKLMFSRNHLISPATGEPMLLPSQDMVLGCYYLTTEFLQSPTFHSGRPFISGTSFYFSNMDQVLQAYFQDKIHLQTPIWLKWEGQIQGEATFSQPLEIRLQQTGNFIELRPRFEKYFDANGKLLRVFIRTTAGRVLFNRLIESCRDTH